ncbi:uncharacterized protein LOC131883988 [Tigriopus californicus]|uniref:uncharacterized protein LOC131883988 n=1 Tax=Tigriopus californicus TaxID=6832 RepID=UPI0027DA0CE1|nr:uncharacterized protein LOC131883988 [Tigriopus californicus]
MMKPLPQSSGRKVKISTSIAYPTTSSGPRYKGNSKTRGGDKHHRSRIDSQSSDEEDDQLGRFDVNRGMDYSTDIKAALSEARKRSVKVFKKTVMDEEEFRLTGGLPGCIERAKSLLIRKKISSAMRYLDFALSHYLRENPYNKIEPPDILQVKLIRAQCLLCESKYSEAQKEADHILSYWKNNAIALSISAEAMYYQCEFERALMTFHQGFNARTELYTSTFKEGIKKSKVAILRTLTALDLSINEWNTSPQGKQLEKSFHRFINDMVETMKLNTIHIDVGDQGPSGISKQILTDSAEIPMFINLSTMAPLCELKNRAKRKISARREAEEQRLAALALEDKPKNRQGKKTRAGGRAQKDLNLKRLKKDEKFLDSLKECFGGKQDEQKKILGRFSTLDPNTTGRKSTKADASVYFSAMNKRKRNVDKSVVKAADEVLEFIGGRKKFWSIQRYGMKEEEKAKVSQKPEPAKVMTHPTVTKLRLQ